MKIALGFVLIYLVSKYTNPVLDYFGVYTDTGKLVGHFVAFLLAAAILIATQYLGDRK